MNNLTVSLSQNILRLSLETKEGLKKISAEVNPEVAKETEILNIETFSTVLFDLIKQLTTSYKNLALNFLIEPPDTIYRFITVNKKNGDTQEQILSEIKSHLEENTSLEDLYFSYTKIAPFVYQFVGIKKDKIEKYLQISNTLEIPLQSVVSWIGALPKFVNKSEPCIFIAKDNQKQVIVLSELNGIYYTGVYEKDRTQQDLSKLIKELSVYGRATPITKVYTINYNGIDFGGNFETNALITELYEEDNEKGYEFHLILNSLINSNPDLLNTQLNLLSLLPTPIMVKKNPALVYTAVFFGALIVVGSVFGGIAYFKNSERSSDNQLAQNNSDQPAVLSETKETTQSTPSENEQEAAKEKELDKKQLSIRIENGAGTTGIAAQNKTYLEGLGYTVTEIGNADELRNTTLVRIKKSKQEYKSLLVDDLKKKYTVESEETLPEDSKYDVLVIIGTK